MKHLLAILILLSVPAVAEQTFSRIELVSVWQPEAVTCPVCRRRLSAQDAPFWALHRPNLPTLYAHRRCLSSGENIKPAPRSDGSKED